MLLVGRSYLRCIQSCHLELPGMLVILIAATLNYLYCPDAIICHILSFLPTKISVATSVLSKRWTYLWRNIPALSFSSTEFTDGFIDHVYKVLAMFQTQTIYQFTLHFEPTPTVDALHIYPWILTALERNVQELKLNFGTTPGQLVRLPSPIFSCKTLVCLKLFDATLMDIPTNGRKCRKSLPAIALRCMSTNLEMIKLTGFCDQKCNWKFVQYVLTNTEVLKEMKIGTSLHMKNRSRRLKNLLEYPRASTACEISFFIDSSGQDFHL
ncbi:hypothetical protein V6N13_050519 [Hibiscus sabdariffa]